MTLKELEEQALALDQKLRYIAPEDKNARIGSIVGAMRAVVGEEGASLRRQLDAAYRLSKEIGEARDSLGRDIDLARKAVAPLLSTGSALIHMAKDWGPRTDPARAEWIVRLGAFERAMHESGKLKGAKATPEDRAVDRFARFMKLKLEANRDKGGWERCGESYLLKRLLEETAELAETLVSCAPTGGPDAVELALECSDVGNFAMMLADVALGRAARDNTLAQQADRTMERVFPCTHTMAAKGIDIARCIDSELREELWCANCRARARFGQSVMEAR